MLAILKHKRFIAVLSCLSTLGLLGGCLNEVPVAPGNSQSDSSSAPQNAVPRTRDGVGPRPSGDGGQNRMHADPRKAVQLEALLAVAGWDWKITKSISGWAVSDWNYLADDLNAYNVLKSWYSGYSSVSSQFYRDPRGYGLRSGYGRGGQCVYFANLILYRSGVYQHVLPSYDASRADYYGDRSYTKKARHVRVGDILRSYTRNGQTAIVIAILSGTPGSSVTRVDVIDSNFVGGSGQEIIGRHVISTSGSGYADLDNYYAIDLIKRGGR